MSEPPTSGPSTAGAGAVRALAHERQPLGAGEHLDERAELVVADLVAALEHRTVHADESGAAALPEQQRRDVAVADERLRSGARRLGIEAVHDAVAAVAAARADDRVDARVGPQLAQLGGAARVVAGEVAIAGRQVVAPHDVEAGLAPALLARRDLHEIDRAGGRGDADRPAAGQSARLAQGRH